MFYHPVDVRLLMTDKRHKAFLQLERAVCVRRHLTQVLWTRKKGQKIIGYRSPVCHDTARAFARVFNLKAVDGEHVYVTEMDSLEHAPVCTTVMHSWVEFEVDGERFILDVLPDNVCPISPTLLRAPHPAYWIPTDPERQALFARIQKDPDIKRGTEILVRRMKSAARRYGLL